MLFFTLFLSLLVPEKSLQDSRSLNSWNSSNHHFYSSQFSQEPNSSSITSTQKRSYVFDSARSKTSFLKIGHWCANRNRDRSARPKHELTWIRIFDGLLHSRWGASFIGAIINGGRTGEPARLCTTAWSTADPTALQMHSCEINTLEDAGWGSLFW